MSETGKGYNYCAQPGCKARVRATGPYDKCSHHRPRTRGGHNRVSERSQESRERRARRSRALGVPEGWL